MITANSTPAAHAGEERSSDPFAKKRAHFANTHLGIIASRAQSQVAAAQTPVPCWSTSPSPEDFDAESLSNLIIAHDWLQAGHTVHVGEKGPVVLSKLIDADDIILLMNQRAQALAGTNADGYPGVTDTEKKILDGALRGWIALCCPPEFLGVQNIRRHTLTDLDMDAAARAVIGGAA